MENEFPAVVADLINEDSLTRIKALWGSVLTCPPAVPGGSRKERNQSGAIPSGRRGHHRYLRERGLDAGNWGHKCWRAD